MDAVSRAVGGDHRLLLRDRPGALERLSVEQIRAQFETNVFGLVRMCQLGLPGMRRQGWGRIVNVSSMGGRLTFPGDGALSSTVPGTPSSVPSSPVRGGRNSGTVREYHVVRSHRFCVIV
jgi:NAD(P)-dependent dehydrogenase (short-subunit alcohol dehydrogenase family)